MKKTFHIVILGLAMMICLAGCQCKHEWVEANCVTPKTCSACGETEGEALPHTWVDADCAAPKTCSVCGETEGEALPHTWIDANFQSPKTCSVCGTVEGEAVPAEYVVHGLDARLLDKGGEYDFTTSCYDDSTKLTTGKLTVASYETFASDDSHEALEDYEWKVVTLRLRFSDDNAQQYGVSPIRLLLDDYYYADEAEEFPEGEEGDRFNVDWNGVNYPECISNYEEAWGSWENNENGDPYIDYNIVYTYRIPVGYNGCVVGVADVAMDWPIGSHLYDIIDDTARLFRLD